MLFFCLCSFIFIFFFNDLLRPFSFCFIFLYTLFLPFHPGYSLAGQMLKRESPSQPFAVFPLLFFYYFLAALALSCLRLHILLALIHILSAFSLLFFYDALSPRPLLAFAAFPLLFFITSLQLCPMKLFCICSPCFSF